MKTKKVITILLVALILASCVPAAKVVPTETAVSPSMFTPAPTAMAIPPTERPHALIQQDTVLYSGPGNADFDKVAELKTGDVVYPLGVYKDFVRVETQSDLNGFVWNKALNSSPENVNVLTQNDVPWKLLYYPQCSPGSYNKEQDSVTFTNSGDGYYDTESGGILLSSPLLISIEATKVTGATFASIKLLGIPEHTDTWWKDITRLDIGYANGKYYLGIRDGSTENYTTSIDLPLRSSQAIKILFDQPEGKSFQVLDGKGQVVKQVDLAKIPNLNLPDGLFPERKVYIGTSVSPKSSFTITGFKIGVGALGQWVETENNYFAAPGLVELAKPYNVTIGTEFVSWRTSDPRYCQIMNRDFNVAVLSDFSWKGFWLGSGQYDFSQIDRAVDYAIQHGWRIRASHLVWGATESNVIPDWLLKGHFTRDEYIKILEQHVKTMVGRYKGKVQEWSIANEASSRSFYSGTDFWNDKIGPDYIEMVFRWARESDPNGILIFNDFNNESPRDRDTSRIIDKMYYTVKKLKEKGVPIDVVGMQMHLLLKWSSPIAPKKDDVIATMRKFADLGVRIYITEFDVDLTKRAGTQAEKWDYEAQLYRDMLEACLESGVCDSFTTWGISDSTSWITCESPGCVNEPNADPLMFDKEFNPKPAYFAIRDVFQNFSMPSTP